MSDSNPAIDVGAGLVFRAGQLLITQRRPGDHLGGLWEFPGGKRHAEESFEECVRRELREELGIEVTVGRLLADLQHTYPERAVRLRFFRCTLAAGEPRPLQVHALVWVTAEQLKDYAFPDADAKLIENLRDTKSIWWE